MAPLAPRIVQTVPTTGDPVPIGSDVATLFPATAEVDPGPFTYAKTADPGNAYTLVARNLQAAIVLDGAYSVTCTISSAGGTSPPTTQTLTFSDDQNHWNDTPDPYVGNPQLPPPIPDSEKWRFFIHPAIRQVVPRSRVGVDYSVIRSSGKASDQVVVGWNTTLLGPYPQTQVETLAQQMSAAWPW